MIYTIKSITDKIENILESLAFILSPIKLYKIMRIFTTNTIFFIPLTTYGGHVFILSLLL